MSGIFARRNYDTCFQSEIIDQTTKPGTIALEPTVARSEKSCYSKNYPHSNRVRNSGDLNIVNYADAIHIENYLLNLDLPNSKCLSVEALTEKNKILEKEAIKLKNIYNVQDCDVDLVSTRYTRLTNNINEIKEKAFNRYEYPLLNPLDFVYYGIDSTNQLGNSRSGISTRIDVKDKLTKKIETLKSDLDNSKKI
jgi:hypothetical protein